MNIIGLMSGSSLDGIDFAYASIDWLADGKGVSWQLHAAETLPLSAIWHDRLRDLPRADARAFARTHTYFGHFLAEQTGIFIEKHGITPSEITAISSHGHTIFHEPDRRFTTQIGCGAALAALTRCKVVCDFRTQDIALDGEGTPLVPIAEQYLFEGYDYYLNIGGIANISARDGDGRFVAFDTSAANQILNRLAQKIGMEYDDNGAAARSGALLPSLLENLSALPYHSQPFPKSLGNMWVQDVVGGIVAGSAGSIADKLHTVSVYIAREVARAIVQCRTKNPLYTAKSERILVTGGGAFNGFLMSEIGTQLADLNVKVVLPSKEIIAYKEALLMCILGFLRLNERPNTLSSVTGAQRDTIGGAVYIGN